LETQGQPTEKPGLLAWFRNWRIRRLEVELAGVEAAIATEAQVMLDTGKVFPTVLANNAIKRARLMKRIKQLGSL
jgi:hypothetical protein